jgi:hypothetical protein
VFGIRHILDVPHSGGIGRLLTDETWQLIIVLHRHDDSTGDTFRETRTGLDHIGLVLPGRQDLLAWQSHLEANGVMRTDAADRPLAQSQLWISPTARYWSSASPTTSSLSCSSLPDLTKDNLMHISRPVCDVIALTDIAPIPSLGFLPINAYVLKAQQPVVIDTGLPSSRPQFLDALWSQIGPADVRWI